MKDSFFCLSCVFMSMQEYNQLSSSKRFRDKIVEMSFDNGQCQATWNKLLRTFAHKTPTKHVRYDCMIVFCVRIYSHSIAGDSIISTEK